MNLRRRSLLAAGSLALAAEPRLALTQAAGKVWHIGVLMQDGTAGWFASLKGALRALGYEEGRNVVFHYQLAMGKPGLLDGMAAELVRAKVDLIVAALNPEALAAKRASSTIPIVMRFASEPVRFGLVHSLARPGGNVTGTTTNPPTLAAKMVELLRDAIPGLAQLTILADLSYPGMAASRDQAERACASLGIRMAMLPVRSDRDLDAAFDGMQRVRPAALFVATTGVLLSDVWRVVDFALRHRLPALYSIKYPVQLGGLMSYSANFDAMAGRNAWMIDRILKGTRPADIPVEEPALFELVINLKSARAIGLTIPQPLLLRADELID